MKPTFWTNTIWYVLLGLTSIVSIVLILYKPENRKLKIAFILSVLGMTYHIEATLLYPFGQAYSYYPKILGNPFLDTVNGNYFSQVSICTTTILLAVYNLSIKYSFIFAAVYYLIEIAFVKLNIYVHHWYKAWYTFAGFIPLSLIIRALYQKLLYSANFLIYYITLFFAVFTAYGHTDTVLFTYPLIRVIHFNFFKDIYKDQLSGAVFHLWILVTIAIALYLLNLKWLVKCMVFLCVALIQYLLVKTGFISIKPGWFLMTSLADTLGCYLWVVAMNYLIQKGKETIKR